MIKVNELKVNTTVAMLIIAVLTSMVYANSLGGDFVFDDRPLIINNEKIKAIKYLPEYFTKGVWYSSELEYKDEFLYRPFSLVNLFLNYLVWGANPFGFHLTSLLLHIANTILLFFLLKKILPTGEVLSPLIGTIIFAVHPVHTESVSFISGATDLILTIFFLSSFLFYLRYRESHRLKFFIFSITFFAVSLLSKEIAIVFPMIIFVYDFIKDKKIYIYRLGVFVFILIIYFFMRETALDRTVGDLQFSFKGVQYIVEFIAGYIKLLLIPWPLGVYFTPPNRGAIEILFSAIVLIGMISFAIKDRWALFAIIWLFITLMPSLSLVFYHSRPIFAERFLYLPSAGFVVLLTRLMTISLKRYQKETLLFVCSVVIAFGFITTIANRDWKDDEVFYSKVIRNAPRNVGGYKGLARYYERKGQIGKAIETYRNALNYIPESDKAVGYENIALIYGKEGYTDRSMFYYQKVLELSPKSSSALVGIGNNYFLRKDYKMALHYYTEAFSIDRNNPEACYNLGLLYESLGDPDKAVYYYNIFLKTAPEGRYIETIQQVRKFLKTSSKP